MARKPTINKPTSNQLLDALQFCSVASERIGTSYETHISLRNNWAIAFNGVIAAGHPIVEDCSIHAHTLLLAEALSKCGEGYSITQLDQNRLVLKYNKFKAIIPCLDQSLMQSAEPDPVIVGITNRFRDAVEAVGVLASENAQHVLTASVLMAGQSVISTNRLMLMEFWHGLDLPPEIALPKAFVAALIKIKRNLIGFGFSKSSATVFFENNCWLKTQLYSDQWPNLSNILDIECNAWPVPSNLWEAISAIENFSKDGNIYTKNGLLCSHPNEIEGASYECKGVPPNLTITINQLKLIKPWAKKIDFSALGPNNTRCIKAIGDNMRCIIAGRVSA